MTRTICTEPRCGLEAVARRLCARHYQAARKAGALPERVTTAERLEANAAPPDARGCRLWTGSGDSSGYGHLKVGGRLVKAHRLAFELATGLPIARGLQVCHRCDVPACVEPTHLFLGTLRDNLADRDAKQRHAHGVRHARALLNDEAVRHMREAYAAGSLVAPLAARYGVADRTAYAAITRKTWRHVP